MNSNYAIDHKREPKKGVSVRLDNDSRKFVETYYPHNKSEFYVSAIETAIKKAKRKLEKES